MAEVPPATGKRTPLAPTFDRRRVVEVHPVPTRLGLLAGMRIRKKLIVLHTVFSLALAVILLVALRPAVNGVVVRAEAAQAKMLLDVLGQESSGNGVGSRLREWIYVFEGGAEQLGLSGTDVTAALSAGGRAIEAESSLHGHGAVRFLGHRPGEGDRFQFLVLRIPEAHGAINRVYLLVILALLAVYALVAISLEVFVLPSAVYDPVRRILAADEALQEGRKDKELIPPEAMPADELGEIMASRNESVIRLRRKEEALNAALSRLEDVANDLRRKNHLLEAARRNLADADRLASLGMMSAGIAHELNTPLTVLKGLVEKLIADPEHRVSAAQAALMLRVVTRLERLGEGLLDFARARDPCTRDAVLRTIVQEAFTLVRLDRESVGIDLVNTVSESVVVECDPDRMVQVMVNLVRNAVDAMASAGRRGTVTVEAERTQREDGEWVSLRVIDDGPGIDANVLPRLFEPFVTTRLDARGTGLGLAVAEGIVREHHGVILARNRTDATGAVFEVMIPRRQQATANAQERPEGSTV
jgi:signal transduction histidine kinase